MGSTTGIEPDAIHDAEYAAQRLGVSKRYIYDLVQAGALKHYKLSHKVLRFSDEQIDEFLASREVNA